MLSICLKMSYQSLDMLINALLIKKHVGEEQQPSVSVIN